MPVPMMAPTPRKVRSSAPSAFLSPAACAPASMCSTFFLRKRDIGEGLLESTRLARRMSEKPSVLADAGHEYFGEAQPAVIWREVAGGRRLSGHGGIIADKRAPGTDFVLSFTRSSAGSTTGCGLSMRDGCR